MKKKSSTLRKGAKVHVVSLTSTIGFVTPTTVQPPGLKVESKKKTRRRKTYRRNLVEKTNE
jgi:hypothetical protein